jgi:hypothetical protein
LRDAGARLRNNREQRLVVGVHPQTNLEAEMLKALLLGTALTIAAAAPSLAQTTTPGTPSAPSTQRPATPPAGAQPMTPPAQPGAQAPARIEGSHLIGLTLRNTANESIGSIDDVIVDRDGRVRQVVVSVGGFLGIGDRKVTIAWDQLRFDQTRDVAMVNLTKDQVRAMPEYRASRNTMPNSAPSSPSATQPSRAPTGTTTPAPGTRQP